MASGLRRNRFAAVLADNGESWLRLVDQLKATTVDGKAVWVDSDQAKKATNHKTFPPCRCGLVAL